MDLRIKWIGEKTLSLLGVDNFELFNNMLDANDGELHEKIQNFVGSSFICSERTFEKVIFYIYRTYYDKLVEVEKEITEWRIVPPTVKIVTPPQSSKKKGKAKDKAAKPKPKTKDADKKDDENIKSELETVTEDGENEDGVKPKDDTLQEIDGVKEKPLEQATDEVQASTAIPPSLDPEVEGTIEYYTLKRFVPMMLKLPKFEGNFGFSIPENTDYSTKFVFFIRILESVIPQQTNETSARMNMPKYFLIGSCKGDFRGSLLAVLKQVYKPLFKGVLEKPLGAIEDEENTSVNDDGISENKNNKFENQYIRPSVFYRMATNHYSENVKDGMKLKFHQNLKKLKNSDEKVNINEKISTVSLKSGNLESDLCALITRLENLSESTERELMLPLPTVPELNAKNVSIEELSKNKQVVSNIENSAKIWSSSISPYLDINNVKNSVTEGPLKEYEFWKTQYAETQMILEELRSPIIKQMLDIIKPTKLALYTKIKDKEEKLKLHCKLSFDNVKLLSTPLTYFKIVTESSDMKTIGDSINGMMNGLRLLWMLSKFYNSDDQMESFLERIANSLCKKIEIYLAVETLFDKPYNEINTLAINANLMLKKWRIFYMTTRQRIEDHDEGKRWEFDVGKLFHKTDHLADICDDLAKVARVLIEFENILGADIKTLVVNQSEIENLAIDIQQLVYPIRTIDFSVFIPDNKENWDVIMNDFNNDKTLLENKTNQFINDIFNNLRSSEEALDVLLKCIKIYTRPSIYETLLTKFDSIWDQFSKEISLAYDTFQLMQDNPPLLKNHPPVSGAILWSWTLRKKINNTWLQFKNIKEMNQSDNKTNALSHYDRFIKTSKNFEENKFNAWLGFVQPAIKSIMESSLLRLKPKELNPAKKLPKLSITVQSRKNSRNDKRLSISRKKSSVVSTYNLYLHSCLVVLVNFDPSYFDAIDEIGILESLGIKFSSKIRQYAEQADKLQDEFQMLTNLILKYNNLIGGLEPYEVKLLQKHLYNFEVCLSPGLDRITWSSLGISEFIVKCQNGLEALLYKHKFLLMIKVELQKLLDKLETYNLFPITSVKYDEDTKSTIEIPCRTFFANIEKSRCQEFTSMSMLYERIGRILIKLELNILDTKTGRSETMQDAYKFWENKIFETLIKISINNMSVFNKILKSNNHIFQVDAILRASEVIMFPTPKEICNILQHNLEDFIERFKIFPRWQKGSCVLCTVQNQTDNEYQKLTFYDDLSTEKNIKSIMSSVLCNVEKITAKANQHIKKLSKYKIIWSYNIQSSCEKYVQMQKPNEVTKFDECFMFYEGIIQELDEHVKHYDIKSIRINMEPVIAQIKNHAVTWKTTLGECLITLMKKKMDSFSNIIERLEQNLNKHIKKLSDFKLVISTANQIKQMTTGAEVLYMSIQETFHMLKSHEITLCEDDLKQSVDLQKKWYELYLMCIYRLETIEKVMKRYSNETLENVEELTSLAKRFAERFFKHGPGVYGNNLDKGLLLMEDYFKMFDNIEIQIEIQRNAESLFDNPLANYNGFAQAKSDYKSLELIFEIFKNMKQEQENLAKILWTELDISMLVESDENIRKEFRKLPKSTRQMPCGESLKSKMDDFRNVIPLLESLKNEAVKDRHWNKLKNKIEKTFDFNADDFSLGDMFNLELNKYQHIVEDVVSCAIKEAAIENDLRILKETWINMKFDIVHHFKNDLDRGYILMSLDEVVTLLDDNSVSLQKMMVSRFVGPFLDEAREWDKKLSLTTEVLDQWLITQNKWLYLESIFIGTDIQHKLPLESENFNSVDGAFIEIMKSAAEKLFILECCSTIGLKDKFISISEELDKCQKAIIDYIDSKRKICPRFYFLSIDELLSVFGNSDPNGVQEYLNKMFNNLKAIKIIKGTNGHSEIGGLISNEDEVLEFRNNIILSNNIEDWMNHVVDEMKTSLRFYAKKAIYDYGKGKHKERITWMLENLGTIGLVSNIVWWTVETEHVFDKLNKNDSNAMKDYLNTLNNRLKGLVLKVREDISPIDYKKLKAVITTEVHMRDIIDSFVMKHVISKEEFEWESQLRTYWIKESDNIQIQQCAGVFNYGHEYMGLNGHLVITPLTDAVYLTITQALTMHLGIAPTGPAGTGKTETVKELAKAMGLLCIIVNCSECLNYRMIGQIFLGLSACGAWGCFDEFDKMNVSVLSMISTQLHSIRNTLTMKLTEFMFEGTPTQIDHKMGIFATVTPAGVGKTELPQSLKAFFRPVMCLVPSFEIICHVSLFSSGFLKAKTLAKKITALYKIANDQLSKQSHYDWGLRSLMALLRMSENIKRIFSADEEEIILMKALRDTNQPKLTAEDEFLFFNLVHDLFRGLEYPNEINQSLIENLHAIVSKKNMIVVPKQIEKVVQLEKILMTQHSAMLVGPTGCGKTAIIDFFMDLQIHNNISVKLTTLNPKAVTVNELYGVQNSTTRDWTDGLLSSIFRKANSSANENTKQYILFDGDVDTSWIENINSVMDDNKLLTLANGERIKLMPHCFLLFEAGDLMYASPATISRAGMLYVDTQAFDHTNYWKYWLNSKTNEDSKVFLQNMYDTFVPKVVNYVFHGMVHIVRGKAFDMILPQSPLNMVVQMSHILDGLLPKIGESVKYDRNIIQSCFIMSIYYSFGSVILKEDLIKFDSFVKKQCPMLSMDDSLENKATLDYIPTAFPTLFEYYINIDKNCWEAWEWSIPKYIHNTAIDFCDILVPNVDTLRITWFINLMRTIRRPLLLTGDVGTSKTATIIHYLKNLPRKDNVTLKFNFSSKTTSMDVQNILEVRMEKRSKDSYGPQMGKDMTIFIDDMNLPEMDKYGTQMPMAFLKLLLEKNGFYDRHSDLKWKELKDTYILAAMGKSGGGRNDMDQRLTSKFSIMNVTFPTDKVMQHIYSSILLGHLKSFSETVQEVAEKLVEMTLDLYKILTSDFLPTPSKFHYIFNLRDISKIIYGLCSTRSNLYPEPKYIIRAWRNEFTRVVCDRMISLEEQTSMQDHVASVVIKNFGEVSEKESKTTHTGEHSRKSIVSTAATESDTINEGLSDEGLEEETTEKSSELTLDEYVLRDPILFGDFRNALNEEPRFYEDLLDYDAVYYLLQEILEDYNSKVQKLPMILFEDCLEHLIRIHRVLRIERSHMMIVGPGSSGKKSMINLAAHAADVSIFEILTECGYNENMFKQDLKKLYNMLGVERKTTVFLISDSQIVHDNFLDFINDMLINGTVSTLFSQEDKEMLTYSIWNHAIEYGIHPEKESVWEFFEKTCAKNLHIVFTSLPGDKLRKRCSKFPGLINNTTIDWIFPWPKEALLSVANNFLADVHNLPEQHREQIVNHVVYIHESAKKYTAEYQTQLKRHNYVTPHHYVNFIAQFLDILNDKEETISIKCKRLEDGVSKIDEANTELMHLNTQLAQQEDCSSALNKECLSIQQRILKVRANTDKKKNEVSEKSMELEKQDEILSVSRKETENALKMAMPALKSAQSMIDELEKSDITEMRSLATPHEDVQTVCETLLILWGQEEISWKNARKIMSDSNFLNQLQTKDFDNVTQNQIKEADLHIKKINNPENIQGISKAAFVLFRYIDMVFKYCANYKDVKPKKDKFELLEKEYNRVKNELDELNADIIKITTELDDLDKKHEDLRKKRKGIQSSIADITKRITTAEKLTLGLSSEKKRWNEELKNVQMEKLKLVGNCLLSSAFLNYAAPFNFEYRDQMVYVDWMNDIQQRHIPIYLPYKVENYLSSNEEINKWNSDRLPLDDFSIQNGILTVHSNFFPLCIDPQMQAFDWIKNMEINNSLMIVKLTDIDYVEQLEIALKCGHPVIIKDVTEEINPILYNLFDRNIKTKLGQKYIQLGATEMEYNPSFRLYLTTKFSNPKLSPTIYMKLVVINYIITLHCLEEQLLSIVIQDKEPELESRRTIEIRGNSDNETLLNKIENELLDELCASTGNLVEDEDFVKVVENIKGKLNGIREKMAIGMRTVSEIKLLREVYRSVAERGAILYFTLLDLNCVNYMYQHSLRVYFDVFLMSIKKVIEVMDSENILNFIVDQITYDTYTYCCRGIYQEHKLLFSFQICINLEKNKGIVTQEQINFFAKCSSRAVITSEISWLTNDQWNKIKNMSIKFPDKFGHLPINILQNEEIWKTWFENSKLEEIELPLDYSEKLTPFEKLLLLRCFRVDRVQSGIRRYITNILGAKYNISPPLQMEVVVQNSATFKLVIFILTSDSDPIVHITQLAESLGLLKNKVKCLSLGRGQEMVALDLLNTGIRNGEWIILQNCHLVPEFLKDLERELEEMTNPDPNFRLWLTTEPTDCFPIGLLQKGIKVIIETPNGLKPHLKNIYLKLDSDQLEGCEHRMYKKIVYCLAYFHAVLQERRKYDKIGWNVSYDFNETDYDISLKLLKHYLDNLYVNECIPWGTLKYLFGEVIYGGRIVDNYDKRLLKTYIDEYFGDFLFDKNQPFYFFDNGNIKFCLPPDSNKKGYIEYIESLPIYNSPEVYGLHSNSEIEYYTRSFKKMCQHMVEMQPETEVTISVTKKEDVILTLVEDMLTKIPPTFDVIKIKKQFEMDITPVAIVLLQELETFNQLIKTMVKTLKILQKALTGEIEMSHFLENITNSLYKGSLPVEWARLTPDTCKSLGDWMVQFGERSSQYEFWATREEPVVMWLSGLQVPESFIVAHIQTTCRLRTWPLEDCTHCTDVTIYTDPTDIEEVPENGCYIRGLYLEGARWDRENKCLKRSHAKILVTELPIVHIVPVKRDYLISQNTLTVPVYITSKRSDASGKGFVFELQLNTVKHTSEWILQGVCSIMNTD